VYWSPTGVNVPDYPKLAQLWWQNIGDVNSGTFTPQQAMDRLAGEMDTVVYQQFINYPNMTVFENIASPLGDATARDSRTCKAGV
jgi:hypothetical protein